MTSKHTMLIAPATAPECPRRAAAPDARLAGLLEQANRPDAPLQSAQLTPTLARDGLAGLTHSLCAPGPDIAQVHEATLPGADGPIALRLYDPAPAEASLPVCLYLHGGGHMAGSIAVYDPICRRLAMQAQCRVLALEYRLAPEHPYPQGLQDCAQALAALPAWLAAQGLALPGGLAGGLTVAGDSAGGALTASLAALAQQRAEMRFARQILIYPSLDYTMALPSIEENASGYLLDARRIRWYFEQYFQSAQPPQRRAASPLHMPATAALPRTLLFTAGFCPLRDEGYAYAQQLQAQGVQCTHWHLPGMIHAFMNMQALVPDACDAVYQRMGQFMRV
ncbi:alpha/beta hydrolase [Vandammella animalimorsus]|uniref:alpha/beta hydrolase n=1 Tax=Vandammella animalimorsus TaxID=2029117 RepID=UPI0031B9BEF6